MSADQMLLSAGVVFLITTILTVIAQIANRIMPEGWVRERHDLAVAIVFLVPVVFALSCLPGQSSGSSLERRASPFQAQPYDPERGLVPMPLAEFEALQRQAAIPNSSSEIIPAPPRFPAWLPLVAMGIWGLGALILLLRLAVDLRAVGRLVRTANPIGVPDGFPLSSPIAMGTSANVVSPMLAGYLRPVVILPEGFSFDGAAAPVLEHEIAHADRHDNWIALGQRIIFALFWWNLPLQTLKPMIHGNREKLCDGHAVEITGAAQALAHALLDVARLQVRQPALPLAVAGERSALAARIKRLARPGGLQSAKPVATLAIIFPILAAVAFLATPRLGIAQTQADPQDGEARADRNARIEAAYAAAENGYGDGLDALIKAGLNPNTALTGDGALLMNAIEQRQVDFIVYLLETGANPNLATPGDSAPLILAARLGQKDTVHRLLEAGADPNISVERDGNPLIAAAKAGNKGVVHILLEAGADPNGYVYRDETPLINAVRKGDKSIASLLVDAGANVSLTVKAAPTDPGGPYRSPLSEAKRLGKTKMVKWLKAKGARHMPPE